MVIVARLEIWFFSLENITMGAVANKVAFAVAITFFSVLSQFDALAQTKTVPDGLSSQGEGAQFAGSNQTATLDCAGGDAQIAGSNNKLNLTGACTELQMLGSGDTVTIAFGKNATIEFVGSNNAITWTTLDGKEPVVQHLGQGNTLTRGQ